jgi:DNA-binding IclR family transcriptional regulator
LTELTISNVILIQTIREKMKVSNNLLPQLCIWVCVRRASAFRSFLVVDKIFAPDVYKHFLFPKVHFHMSKVKETGGAQTVDRALAVLKLIIMEDRPMLLEELAQRAGLNSSVAYRLVRSLVAAGFVYREPEAGGYGVGASLISMGVMIAGRIDLRRVVRPFMQSVVSEFGETASLHVRSGDQRICVEVVDGTHAVRRIVPIGEALPLYVGETGRIFLSFLSEEEQRAFIGLAAASGLDASRLGREIALVRRRGFFVGIGERTADVGSLSVAVLGPDELLGVITVSGPSNRWSRSAMDAAAPRILELIRPISSGLGTGELQ